METQPLTRVAVADSGVERYFAQGLMATLRIRLAWLVALLLMQSLSASMIEAVGPSVVVVAFAPMVVGAGGSAGNQAVVAVTRAIDGGVSNADAWRIVGREAAIAAACALVLAATSFARVAATDDAAAAAAVAAAVLGVVGVAAIAGTTITLLMDRLSVDPAAGAAPLLSTLMDLLGVGVLMVASLAL